VDGRVVATPQASSAVQILDSFGARDDPYCRKTTETAFAPEARPQSESHVKRILFPPKTLQNAVSANIATSSQ
jgi:hypothetical protein